MGFWLKDLNFFFFFKMVLICGFCLFDCNMVFLVGACAKVVVLMGNTFVGLLNC